MSKFKPSIPISQKPLSKPGKAGTVPAKDSHGKAIRETIESIAVAVVLAFLFRAFVAEAFVIPTGSMAPTLQGRHMDVVCEKCGYQYRTGASLENDGDGEVLATTCPICGYTMSLQKTLNPNQRSFSGDRILVSKFAYEIADPKRWDVIVFKYPGNAKQNYIKRLVGLPNETLRIRHGDIYYRPNNDPSVASADFRIARKDPYKLRSMLQLVHDTNYQSPELLAAGWPLRWQDWQSPDSPKWAARSDEKGFELLGVTATPAWLRYRHVIPTDDDWEKIERGRAPTTLQKSEIGRLISDYYEYNDGEEKNGRYAGASRRPALGMHWVGDLAVEAWADVRGDSGNLLLDLVEGGVHYTCRIDVATGEAVLSIDQGRRSFVGEDGTEVQHPQAKTRVQGAGRYRLMLANCDDQLVLWVNRRVVTFDGPTTYLPDRDVKPQWSPEDAGDLEPAGIGADGVELAVSRLRLYRDVYYISATYRTRTDTDYEDYIDEQEIREIFASPDKWSERRFNNRQEDLFDNRRAYVEFDLGDGEFFPLGDNSPQSRDARLWSQGGHIGLGRNPPPFVRRDLLTGKALLVYWPHPWNAPIPYFPNFQRMGLIR